MKIKLKPCPFCGSQAIMKQRGTAKQSCIIRCENCGASVESGEEGENCGNWWNRREQPLENNKARDESRASDAAPRPLSAYEADARTPASDATVQHQTVVGQGQQVNEPSHWEYESILGSKVIVFGKDKPEGLTGRALLTLTPLYKRPQPKGWQPIETAPKDEIVQVYTPPQPEDWPDAVRITFDYISSDIGDDYWYYHGEHFEHFCCVAKPEGSTGPSEKAPYTHWMPMPPAPESNPIHYVCRDCKSLFATEFFTTTNADGKCSGVCGGGVKS